MVRTDDETKLVPPSVCCQWTSQQVFDAGYITQFGKNLNAIGEMHYPNNNCGISGTIDPQSIFANYLTHKAAQIFIGDYINIVGMRNISYSSQPNTDHLHVAEVQAAGLSFVMLETNTASCGGFPGLSDSFGAGLWAIGLLLSRADEKVL
jgi:hypothetical protein